MHLNAGWVRIIPDDRAMIDVFEMRTELFAQPPPLLHHVYSTRRNFTLT